MIARVAVVAVAYFVGWLVGRGSRAAASPQPDDGVMNVVQPGPAPVPFDWDAFSEKLTPTISGWRCSWGHFHRDGEACIMGGSPASLTPWGTYTGGNT